MLIFQDVKTEQLQEWYDILLNRERNMHSEFHRFELAGDAAGTEKMLERTEEVQTTVAAQLAILSDELFDRGIEVEQD